MLNVKMRTAGRLLREKREQLGQSYEQIEKAIRIRKYILKNIEDSNWDSLPSPTHTKGFIKNYGDYLGLDTQELLALFRREVDEKKSSTPKNVFRTQLFRSFGLKPGLIFSSLVAVVVVGFFAYLYREYRSFIAPPYLEVIEPSDNLQTENSQITVVGNTDTQAILKINGTQVDLSPGGTFSVPLNLPQGKSTVVVTSENRFGGVSTVKREIVIEDQQAAPSVASVSATPLSGVELILKIGPNPARIKIDSDTKEDFEGLLFPNVTREFSGEKSIKIRTQNAGSTTLIVKGQSQVLGKEGETKEIEIKP